MASSFLALLLPESRESPIANSIIGHAQASSLQHAPQRGRETTVSIPASMSWRCESPDICEFKEWVSLRFSELSLSLTKVRR